MLNDLKTENLPFKLRLIFQEFLLFRRNLTSDHSLSASLLLVSELPVLEGLDSGYELVALFLSASSCLLVKSGLSVDDERQKLHSIVIQGHFIKSIGKIYQGLPLFDTH